MIIKEKISLKDDIARARMKLEDIMSRDSAKAIDALIKLRVKEYEESKKEH